MRDRWHFGISGLVVIYVGFALIPTEVLFNPSAPVFSDALEGENPKLEFYTREVLWDDTSIRFMAVVREVGEAPPVCVGQDGPFHYLAVNGPVLDKNLDWWTGHAHDCLDLPPGTYWTHTTWVVERPLAVLLPDWLHLDSLLGGLIPNKEVSRDGPPFTIHPNHLRG